jgi:hypothetical protein
VIGAEAGRRKIIGCSPIHKELPQPDDPSVLAWSCLDLPKLLALLLKKELHLTRLDSLEDKIGGRLLLAKQNL